MKSFFFFAIISGMAINGYAQAKPAVKKTVSPPKTISTVTPSSFEASLVQGTLTLTKEFKPGDGKEFIAVYSLLKNDAGFNNRKPIPVSLSRQSFDSVFTKTTADLAAKWPVLNRHIEENKISLTTENGWISVITLFNNLRQ